MHCLYLSTCLFMLSSFSSRFANDLPFSIFHWLLIWSAKRTIPSCFSSSWENGSLCQWFSKTQIRFNNTAKKSFVFILTGSLCCLLILLTFLIALPS